MSTGPAHGSGKRRPVGACPRQACPRVRRPATARARPRAEISVTSRAGRRTCQAVARDGSARSAVSFAPLRGPGIATTDAREGEIRDTKSAAAATRATVYGYPRQGPNRELKKAIEGYWKGRVTADALRSTAAGLRQAAWRQLGDAGIDEVPTGDFSYYDHVLDTSVMVGAIPARHRAAVDADALDGYFAMARGTQDVAPLEMTKWFDTNYHYLVPELGPDTVFRADSAKQVAELTEALALGLAARPVLVGPGHLPPAGQARPRRRRRLRAADAAGPAAARVRRGAGRPAGRRRRMGAAGRARPRPGPHSRRAERRRTRLPRARRPHRPAEAAGRLLLRPSRRGAARSWPRRRSTGSRSTSPDRRPPTWTTSPPPAACPASAWSRASSTAATSGSTTSRRPCPRWAPCSASPAGSTSRRPAPCCTSRWTPPSSTTSTRRSPAGSPSPARRRPRSSRSLAGWRGGTDAIAAELAANRADLAARAGVRHHPRPGRTRPRRGGHRRRRPPLPAVRRTGRRPARPARAAAAADDHHRLVPADRRAAHGPRRPARRGASTPPAYEERIEAEIREVISFQENDRHRRPGARRARAQRHGAVLRRAAHRLPRHRSTAGSSPTAPATYARRSWPATSPGPRR